MTPFRFFIRISLKYAHACTPQISKTKLKTPPMSTNKLQNTSKINVYTQKWQLTCTQMSPNQASNVKILQNVNKRHQMLTSFRFCTCISLQHAHACAFEGQQVIQMSRNTITCRHVQGYLAPKTPSPRRTQQSPYAQGPMATQGGWVLLVSKVPLYPRMAPQTLK